MPSTIELDNLDRSANRLARPVLFITLGLAWLGGSVGFVAHYLGQVTGLELALCVCSVSFSTAALVTLQFFRRVDMQTVATVATIFFALNLCAGMTIAVFGSGQHLNLFVYLLWFFPLLMFNKLVNAPVIGRFLVKLLMALPLVFLVSTSPRLLRIFESPLLVVLSIYALTYLCAGLMLDRVTRYREEYIAETGRAEARELESRVLESIEDCFISLDLGARLVYANDAACAELSVKREEALQKTLLQAVPPSFSRPMLAGMAATQNQKNDTIFEVEDDSGQQTYAMRCYPRPDGLSVYFRNVTTSTMARRDLERAYLLVREQSELLDKAHDAIFTIGLDHRFTFWNKGAEALYGWPALEVLGQQIEVLFGYERAALTNRIESILSTGEWNGELSQRRSDGSVVRVESHCNLVNDDLGEPHSILAINTDITERNEAHARIEQLAYYDALTELPNRQLLQSRIANGIETAAQKGTVGALLFINLDDFKTINTALGHDRGDELLQQTALRLMAIMRPNDTVGRFGGDEFVMMLQGLSPDAESAISEAKDFAEVVMRELRRPYDLMYAESDITASIGITLFPEWEDSPEDLFKRASLAMYQAKSQGRNTVCVFDPAMQERVANRAALISDLRRALPNQQFELHYQPQFDNDCRVTGAEALLRWRHPRRGMVPPNEFIPLAEEAGFIVELGRYVLETACSQLALWAKDPVMEPLSLAVNVSVRQFMDSHFVDIVSEVIQNSGARPEKLKLEITESSVMERTDEVIAKMAALCLQGVSFSLDDFGTGYSSLSHLKRLPLVQLKIDRSFVKDVLTNPKDASIARTIIMLGRNLDLSVIAEGVETEEQRRFLEDEGCYAYQGYLFSPALTQSKFEEFVKAMGS